MAWTKSGSIQGPAGAAAPAGGGGTALATSTFYGLAIDPVTNHLMLTVIPPSNGVTVRPGQFGQWFFTAEATTIGWDTVLKNDLVMGVG